ncbi:MAG: hypothetical protein CMB61_01690 [Euryarchaeota archaeon]|nr:hypothetical protein [Euryarchaeota archaeon]
MVPSDRRSRRTRINRKDGARLAMNSLSRVFERGISNSSKISDNAARHILFLGKKHGIRPTPKVRRLICRTCKESLIPGRTSRVRIASKRITTTCLRCGRVNREGPDFGCEENE